MMVADEIRQYLEDGTIHNSVNFPDLEMPRNGGHRLLVINSNVPHMIERISRSDTELQPKHLRDKHRVGMRAI
jgi:D-3-phosphoglycerate dehydrogenase